MELSSLATRHRNEALRAIRNRKYEHTEDGILIPSMKLNVHGAFEAAKGDGPWDVAPNKLVGEGLTDIVSTYFDQASQKMAFYVALFGGNVTVADTWTAANFTANATEFTNYTEANRVLWEKDPAANGAVGNTTTPAVFTMGVGGGTVRGAALLSASAKSATTGVLVAAARLAADKVMAEAEELRVRYTVSATSS